MATITDNLKNGGGDRPFQAAPGGRLNVGLLGPEQLSICRMYKYEQLASAGRSYNGPSQPREIEHSFLGSIKVGESSNTGRVSGFRGSGLRLARIWGIELRLDVSVLIIFGLVVYSLGAGLFPSAHPDWDRGLTWGMALAAGCLFFVSLLAHELAHSVVAQLRGIRVPRITLFVFGGASEMEREPDTPATELLVTIVGPLTSLLLGVAFTRLGLAFAGESFASEFYRNPQQAAAALGPLATLLLWLGPINLMLGIFNLVPGFPLDGGRVLRALLWWGTGDLDRATRWASQTGRGVAWLLMGFGAFQALQGLLVQGLWLLLIGWFLNNAARTSYSQLLLQRALTGLRVTDLMRTRFETVAPEMSIERFVEEHLLRSAQSVWPVVEKGRLLGLVGFDDVRRTPERDRAAHQVREVMKPADVSLRPQLGGREALEALLRSDSDPMPVVEDRKIVGLLHRADIMRWLAMHHLGGSAG
jgi:Zn-dependent protease/CBS domain-containing protein